MLIVGANIKQDKTKAYQINLKNCRVLLILHK